MVAYTKPQQREKEESGQLRGERDKIKINDGSNYDSNICKNKSF